MRGLICALFSLLFLAQANIATGESSAEAFLRNKIDAATTILQNEGVEQQKQNEEVAEIVSAMFDFPLMAKLTLGSKYWPSLTRENKDKFTELFIRRLKKTYSAKLTLYRDETVLYESATKTGKKVQISTYLVSKHKKTSIVYKLYKSKNDWQIYDLEIEGVSVVRSYRAQFADILRRGTIDDLLLKLEKSVET
ncbi:MAG: ABC transporter substrate-binding protein [Deltaproteobacteria bacterium]|nr:ABC transporter substrate-binding protein [Deltaproteobacteria bacterium]